MMVASQWKMSSSALGPALHEVGGSFWRSCDAEVRGWERWERSASVARRARDRVASRERGSGPGLRPAFFWGCSLPRAREEKNWDGSRKPYGRGAIAAGATFVRARTCSSLVIRLDAIVNLRWLCEKRDSGGRGKPRLVVNGERRNKRETRDFLTASRRW